MQGIDAIADQVFSAPSVTGTKLLVDSVAPLLAKLFQNYESLGSDMA